MKKLENLPKYKNVIKLLECENNFDLPAELHGFISGIFSGSVNKHDTSTFDAIIKRIQEEGFKSKSAQKFFSKISEITTQKLQSPDFDFQLLLPDDNIPIIQRCDALIAWSRGFLSGLGLTNLSSQLFNDPIFKEALYDINKIARVTLSELIPDEASEEAHMELVEFVRIAVMLIYSHIHGRVQTSTKLH